MPIRREYRWFYPIDWPQLSAAIRFGRAKGRCEHCRRPHGRLVFHLGDGRWWDEEAATWRNGRGRALSLLTQPPAPGDDDDPHDQSRASDRPPRSQSEQQQDAQSQSLLSTLPHVA